MNIVFICHRIPYPPNKGDKIRSYNLLKYFARSHKTYLICLIDNKNDLKYIECLEELTEAVYFDVIHPRLKKVFSSVNLLRGYPISAGYFYSNKIQKAFDHLLDNISADLLFCFCSPTAEYLFCSRHRKNSLQRITKVMDLVDVDSEKWKDYAQRTSWPQSLIYHMESRYLARYERKIAKEFDRLFVVSEPEKALFLKNNPSKNISVLSNGVDLDYFTPEYISKIKKTSPTLVFTGAMDYWPNIDGVIWFATKIFPVIRNEFPDSTFYIVGGNPAPAVRSLSHIDGVKVTGFVEDVRDYIAIADACVVPLRVARGIQNKVLEGMAMGKPVIATSQAALGIVAEQEKELLIADNIEEFITAVKNLLVNKALCTSISKRARQRIELDYNWAKQLENLDELLRK